MFVIVRVFFRYLDKVVESKLGYDVVNLVIGFGYGDFCLWCVGGKWYFVFCFYGVSIIVLIIGMVYEFNILFLVVFEIILLSLDDNF